VAAFHLGGAGARAAEAPAVARAELPAHGARQAATIGGTVFFLALPGGGVAAVGAAHSFDLARLAEAPAVEFRLGRTGRRVARSTRFLAPPGRPFADPNGSLREDFVLFALEAPPAGARVLVPVGPEGVREGDRVRLLGVPAMAPRDEDDLFGRVVSVESDRLELELDVEADLRGWGGAPVVDAKSGRVLGLVEAAWPERGRFRLGAAPLTGILAAAAAPLDGGRGLPFAAFRGGAPGGAAAGARRDEAPAPRAAAPAAQPASAGGQDPAWDAGDDAAPAGSAPDVAAQPPPHPAASLPSERAAAGVASSAAAAAAAGARSAPAPAAGDAPLLGPEHTGTRVELSIDYPAPGEVFGGSTGGFLAGRALAVLGPLRRFDVVLVLDTSGSTSTMTGADVNANGIVGKDGLSGLFRGVDEGDSILSAEVAAARKLLRDLDPRAARVGLVTFAGAEPSGGVYVGGMPVYAAERLPAALTEQPLTRDYAQVERALDQVLARGPSGGTHMAAGLDQAVIELLGLRGALSEPDAEATKVVLFLTDGEPTLPVEMALGPNVEAAVRAADRARRARVQVHTFALGPEALSGPIAPVEMAQRTGGLFTPVRHPGDIGRVVDEVNLANIESVRVRNATTGRDADEVEVGPDGSFRALVPLAPGKNTIEVVARASDGSERAESIVLQHAPDAEPPEAPPEYLAARNALLEKRLTALKQVNVDLDRERADQARRELLLEIDRERAAALERAAAQRRELRLEATQDAPGQAAPSGADPAPSGAPAAPARGGATGAARRTR